MSTTTSNNIRINNVRLSYPNLFVAKAAQKNQEPKFSASFIIDKRTGASIIEALKNARSKAAAEFWNNNVPKGVKSFLRDGIEKEDVEGYGPDVMFLNASSKRQPPCVLKDSPIPLSKDQAGKFYAGCYVNVVIRVWCQDNEYGKRVNASLEAVQFERDGDPLGGGAPVDTETAFDYTGSTGGSGNAAADSDAWD